MKRQILLAIALLALTTLAGCACGGTETGNCGAQFGALQSAGDSIGALPSIQLREAICSKLTACDASLSTSDCREGIGALSTLDTELGLAAGAYSDFDELVSEELEGDVSSSASALAECVTAIGALSCTDAPVQDAWDPGSPTDFDAVEAMIPSDPGSCPDVY